VEIRQHGLEYRGERWGFAAWEHFLVGINMLRWGCLGRELRKWGAILRSALHGCPLNRLIEILILPIDIGRTKTYTGGGNALYFSFFI